MKTRERPRRRSGRGKITRTPANHSKLDARTTRQITELLDKLPGMERAVIDRKFGLTRGQAASRADIARDLSLTTREVGEIEQRGLARLRETADEQTLMRLFTHLTS